MQTHNVLPKPPTVQSKIVSELKYWKAFQCYSGLLPEQDFPPAFGVFIFRSLPMQFYNPTFSSVCFSHKVYNYFNFKINQPLKFEQQEAFISKLLYAQPKQQKADLLPINIFSATTITAKYNYSSLEEQTIISLILLVFTTELPTRTLSDLILSISLRSHFLSGKKDKCHIMPEKNISA